MNVWVEAARPRTLPASIAPVIVGTAAAERFIPGRAAAAFVVSIALQVAVNLANDLFDAQSGVDTAQRLGPRRAVASGLVSPTAMKRAIVIALAVAAIAGLALAVAVGWELLVVGLAAIAAALAYSGGPRPYGSAALGEVMVFVFFGLVATAGSAYVQDERLRSVAVLVSVPIGLLAAAILVANNLRDIPTDREAGKRTLAVVLGPSRTAALYRGLVVASFLLLPAISIRLSSPWPLVAAVAFVLAVAPLRAVRADADAPTLIGVLGATARVQLAFATLLALGLWISN